MLVLAWSCASPAERGHSGPTSLSIDGGLLDARAVRISSIEGHWIRLEGKLRIRGIPRDVTIRALEPGGINPRMLLLSLICWGEPTEEVQLVTVSANFFGDFDSLRFIDGTLPGVLEVVGDEAVYSEPEVGTDWAPR
jgi:hypothetical protein